MLKVTEDMKDHIKGLHRDSGMNPTMDSILWGMIHYIQNSPAAMEKLLDDLKVDRRGGKMTEEYFVLGPYGEDKIPSDKIVFFEGCLVNNQPFPVSGVEVYEAEEVHCMECGGSFPCSTKVKEKTAINEDIYVCNHCQVHSPDLSEGRQDICDSCDKNDCIYHPLNPNNITKLTGYVEREPYVDL